MFNRLNKAYDVLARKRISLKKAKLHELLVPTKKPSPLLRYGLSNEMESLLTSVTDVTVFHSGISDLKYLEVSIICWTGPFKLLI